MYDDTCKFIAETFTGDITSWLLGKPVLLTRLEPSELSLEPIRADSIILLQSDEMVLHAEFQTNPKPDVPFRMTDYRLRGYHRYPQKEMQQVVIYLRRSNSPLVYQNRFELSRTQHEFDLIRLWEQPTQLFLQAPGLLPFAALSRTNQPDGVLRRVAARLKTIANPRQQSNILASTAILAGLVLENKLVQTILRQDTMRESSVYQAIEAESRHKEATSMISRLLKRRLGEFPSGLKTQIQALSVAQLEDLGEALLDFSTVEDLVTWLQTRA